MHDLIDTVMIVLVLSNLMILGASRLSVCIRTVAIQGILLGLLPPLLAHEHVLGSRVIFLASASIGLRGIMFPWLLFRTLRDADVRREVEPFVGYSVSILGGVVALAGSFWLASRLPVAAAGASRLVFPVALSTMFVGLFVIVSRKLALNQVLGYLVLENGIYAFGLALVGQIPMLVELGVLMDAFVAVFVMSIATYHISREFDHIDVDRLDSLRG